MLGISILVVLYVYDAGISPNAAVVLNEYPMTRIVPERVSNFPFFSKLNRKANSSGTLCGDHGNHDSNHRCDHQHRAEVVF